MNCDINDYLMETLARERVTEARRRAASHEQIRQAQLGRAPRRPAAYSLGVTLVRLGLWVLARTGPGMPGTPAPETQWT